MFALLCPKAVARRFYAILLLVAGGSATTAVLNAQTVPMSLPAREEAVLLWDYESGQEGWTAKSAHVSNLRAENGCLRGDTTGNDANISVPGQVLNLRGHGAVVLRVWMAQTATFQLYWANEDGGISGSRVVQQVVPGQQWTIVRFDLATHAQWNGKWIGALRLDPGTISGNSFAIDYVAVLQGPGERDGSTVLRAYDFETGHEGWNGVSGHVAGFVNEEGRLKGTSTGNDPFVNGPLVSLAGAGGVAVQVKSSLAATFMLYWSNTEGGMGTARSSSQPIQSGGWQTLWFDLRSHPHWAGKTITRLRLDPSTLAGQQFEIDSVVVLKPEAFSDEDGDGLNRFGEAMRGSDPLIAESLPGRMAAELWTPLPHYSTRTLVADSGFYGPPGIRQLYRGAGTGAQTGVYFAGRYRGYLVAPATGEYRFWLAARNGAEFLLAPDEGKFAKVKLAEINPELGDGHGVMWGTAAPFDQSPWQMSAPVLLQKGQSYYFEVVHANGHGSGPHATLAWARPGAAREVIPATAVTSYLREASDADDDCLPDLWETEFGLDPTDNGAVDTAREGERGDHDSDGLANLAEYLLGTDPTDADTDGDGIVDGIEFHSLGSNALVADAPADTLHQQIDLASYVSSSTVWHLGERGLLADNFRGEVTWDFTVPSSGHWLARVEMELMGTVFGNEEVPVVILVDGRPVHRGRVRFGTGHFTMVRALTPWIAAGGHQLTVKIDNAIARRSVRLVAVSIHEPADATGMLAKANRLAPPPASTRVSPLCVEGWSRDPSVTTVAGQPAISGMGGGHWFANVPLHDQSSTQTYTVAFETGSGETRAIVWQPTNTVDGETLVIRQGDSLRVGAWGSDPEMASTVALPDSTLIPLVGAQCVAVPFPQAGTFVLSGTLAGGGAGSLTVKVIAPPAFPGGTIDALDNVGRALQVPSTDALVRFDVPTDLCRLSLARSGTNASITLMSKWPEPYAVLARLPSGPILSTQPVNVIGVSDAFQNDLTAVGESGISGYKLLTTPLTVLNLPPGGRVDVSIYRAGVMFPNGTTLRSISPSELTNGWVALQFLFPIGQPGGYCHNLHVYDRNGVFLGSR